MWKAAKMDWKCCSDRLHIVRVKFARKNGQKKKNAQVDVQTNLSFLPGSGISMY